jgi:2,4-dienoyl-CoA reductase-like NADH-dependent reductase (Old Yellow Enzyme family)
LRFYEEIAKGGAGGVIVENTSIVKTSTGDYHLGIYDDGLISQLAYLSKVIKKHDSRAFIQLNHRGPKALSKEVTVSVSEVPIKKWKPRRLETSEIYEIIERFIEAGRRSSESGFDGVELHAAPFYLLSAFLSRYTNDRTDEFGGNIKNRVKIVSEIVKGIKKEVGKNYPVICRINAVELMEDGITLDESIEISKELESSGVDIIHVSAYDQPISPSYSDIVIPVGDTSTLDTPRGKRVKYSTEIKKIVNIPLIVVGKLDDPELANKIIRERKADLIAIGRGLLADPYLPQKALEGRIEEINQCIYCNACHTSIQRSKPITCPINTSLGK